MYVQMQMEEVIYAKLKMKHKISEYDTVIGMLNDLEINQSRTYYTDEKNIKFVIRKCN